MLLFNSWITNLVISLEQVINKAASRSPVPYFRFWDPNTDSVNIGSS